MLSTVSTLLLHLNPSPLSVSWVREREKEAGNRSSDRWWLLRSCSLIVGKPCPSWAGICTAAAAGDWGVACLPSVCSHDRLREWTRLSFNLGLAPSPPCLLFLFVSSKRDRVVLWIHSHSASITFKNNLFLILITLPRGLGPRKLSFLVLWESTLAVIFSSREVILHLWQERRGSKIEEAC